MRGNFTADAYVAHIIPHLRQYQDLLDQYIRQDEVLQGSTEPPRSAIMMQDNSKLRLAIEIWNRLTVDDYINSILSMHERIEVSQSRS